MGTQPVKCFKINYSGDTTSKMMLDVARSNVENVIKVIKKIIFMKFIILKEIIFTFYFRQKYKN